MGKLLRKAATLAVGLALLLSVLPATGAAEGTVSGAELRAGVVRRTEDVMNVEWTLKTRVAKTDILGDPEREAQYYPLGIWPTTYFEYPRLRFVLRGVMVNPRPATLEEFQAQIDPAASVVPGVGHITLGNGELRGMSPDAFVTDVTGRVLPVPAAGVKAALTADGLTALADRANLSAASSKAALGSFDAAKAGYAKLGQGDLLLAWDDGADPEKAPKLHAMVVKSADAAKEQATVMYPAYELVTWHFKCDTCGAEDTEGPTSAPLPVHVNSSSSASFVSYKKHSETHPGVSCGGTWTSTYGTTWRTETVSFRQLFGEGGETVPGGSQGYLPYTLNAYATGEAAANVRVSSAFRAETYPAGFAAAVDSDYRITSVKAVLTSGGAQVAQSVQAPALGSTHVDFSGPEIDRALLELPMGSACSLRLYVRSGPMSAADAAQGDYRLVYSSDFRVEAAAVGLSADRSYLVQGEPFQVSVKALKGGLAAVSARISFDPSLYEFDLAASRADNSGVELSAERGTVVCRRSGAALSAGQAFARLTFRPRRTGLFPITAGTEAAWIRCVEAEASESASGALAPVSPDASVLPVTIGYATQIFKNYAGGCDLILVYTATEAQRTDNRNSTVRLAYDGAPMYDVSSAKYAADGDRFIRTYGYIVRNAAPEKVGAGSSACPVLTYSNDVNQSRVFDVSDVQAAANVVSGELTLTGNMPKWLMADADRNGRVDRADVQALLDALMK